MRPGRRGRIGTKIVFDESLSGEVVDIIKSGVRIIRFSGDGDFESIVDKIGHVPLPPYIEKDLEDDERYQTVYARSLGSSAAPTAGLHFTPDLHVRSQIKVWTVPGLRSMCWELSGLLK